MSDIDNPASAEKENTCEEIGVVRPNSVVAIAGIFFVLAVIDFCLNLKSTYVYLVSDTLAAENLGFQFSLFWLILYPISAGLMRGGEFARVVASIFGVLALLIPGAVIIYFLFYTEAKNYFSNKRCTECGDTKYLNDGFLFKGINCKKCGDPIDLSNTQ